MYFIAVHDLALIAALILANGVFAAAEIALIALRETRLEELAAQGSRPARAALALRRQPERFFATVQVGVTVVGATAAGFGGARLAADLEPSLTAVPEIAPYARDLALALVIGGVSFLSLVFGELVPKSLALRHAERYALLVSPALLALSAAARPIVWFLTKSSNLVLRPFGDRTSFSEARLSPSELQQLVTEAAEAGQLDQRTGEIASRALGFGELTAAQVMVPRNFVVAVDRDAPAAELHRLFSEHGHTRLPVYRDDDLDEIVGYVSAKDLLARSDPSCLPRLGDIIRRPLFVPETATAPEVLQLLQSARMHMAIVVDEHGGTAGMITVEDLLEELVGEMFSEHRLPEANVSREAPDRAIVRGLTPIREVNRALGIDLPEEDVATMSGLVLQLAGRIPEPGVRLQAAPGIELEVVDASARLVRLVRVWLRDEAYLGAHP